MFPCQVLVNIYSKKFSYINYFYMCIFNSNRYIYTRLMLANTIKFVLFKFNDNLPMLNQSLTLLHSLLTSIHSSFKSYLEHIMVASSANKTHLNMEDTLHKSLI